MDRATHHLAGVVLAWCLFGLACQSNETGPRSVTSQPGSPAQEQVAAAPPNTHARSESPAEASCIRTGSYVLTSDAPAYLSEDGKLPPPAEREQVDGLADCAAFARLDNRLTIARAGSGHSVTFADDTAATLVVTDVTADGCILSFSVHNEGEPGIFDGGSFTFDFSRDPIVASAHPLRFSILLDGEDGQAMFECTAESASIAVARSL